MMEARMEREPKSTAQLAAELGQTATELYQSLDVARQLEEHPYRTLAVAAGVGYVLGGGLFTSLTASLVRVGVRAALLPMVQHAITGIAEAAGGESEY
jgi:hypothetical protein